MVDLYLSRGILPIPVVLKDKTPLIKWSAWADRRPPDALVKRTFAKYANCNIGALCGVPSGGLVVVDFDRPLDYHRWKRENSAYADTLTVRTSRGYHVYVRVSTLPARSFDQDGVLVKSNGYVVAPASTHRSGAVYRFINEASAIMEADDVTQFGFAQQAAMIVEIVTPSSDTGDSLIQVIKTRIPITRLLSRYTELYPKDKTGEWLMARCPFHDDHRPSMWVNAHWGVCRCYSHECIASRNNLDVVDVYALVRCGNTLSTAVSIAVRELSAELQL